MWKLLSTIATILSFISAFYLWSKVRKKIEDKPYHYGDSLYRGEMHTTTQSDPNAPENQTYDPIYYGDMGDEMYTSIPPDSEHLIN